MGLIYPTSPTLGEPTTTEDPKIKNFLDDLLTLVNGNIDNDNIGTSDKINGSKLADASVDTLQLANDSVTNDKIDDNAVKSGQMNFSMFNGSGTTTSSGVQTSIANVTPGVYIALGQIATNGGSHTFTITSSGGTVTIYNGNCPYSGTEVLTGGSGSVYVGGSHYALVVVAATSTIRLEATRTGGTIRSSLSLIGFPA